MKNPYSIGKQVYLRHPTEADAEGPWHEWLSDEETTRWLGERYWPNSIEKQRAFAAGCNERQDALVLLVIDIETDKPIGVGGLSSINWVHRYSDLAIIIGDKDFRKGPHMIDAVAQLLRIAFLRLNLRTVKSFFADSNEATRVIHDLFHFKYVGRMPGLLWDRGKYVDLVAAMLDRDTWMERQGVGSNDQG